jgi:hypothetical protein
MNMKLAATHTVTMNKKSFLALLKSKRKASSHILQHEDSMEPWRHQQTSPNLCRRSRLQATGLTHVPNKAVFSKRYGHYGPITKSPSGSSH